MVSKVLEAVKKELRDIMLKEDEAFLQRLDKAETPQEVLRVMNKYREKLAIRLDTGDDSVKGKDKILRGAMLKFLDLYKEERQENIAEDEYFQQTQKKGVEELQEMRKQYQENKEFSKKIDDLYKPEDYQPREFYQKFNDPKTAREFLETEKELLDAESKEIDEKLKTEFKQFASSSEPGGIPGQSQKIDDLHKRSSEINKRIQQLNIEISKQRINETLGKGKKEALTPAAEPTPSVAPTPRPIPRP